MEYITKQGDVVVIDDADWQRVSHIKWLVDKSTGYVRGYHEGKRVKLHRWLMSAGPRQMIDHKNRNKLDNRRVNLRLCTASQNSSNRTGLSSSKKYKGVFYCEEANKYRVIVDGKHIGYYSDIEAAANAYNHKAQLAFGDFALLNAVEREIGVEECETYKKKKHSKYKGVVRHPSGWASRITVDNKSIYIGFYKTEEEAALAYDRYVLEYQLGRKTNDLIARKEEMLTA